MKTWLTSTWMFYLLVCLLVLALFLPDLIGPIPALLFGGSIIAFALFVYNQYSSTPAEPADQAEQNDE